MCRNDKVSKEGCYRGHGLSAAINLGSLGKTVIASLFHPGLHSGAIFCGKNDVICYSIEQQVMSFFGKKKTQKSLWCQIDFLIICNFFCFSQFLIKCHTKVLFWRIHASLGPKWKNPGTGVISLMAADKPCPQVSSTMSWVGCLLKDSKFFVSFAENSQIILKLSVFPILLTFIYRTRTIITRGLYTF